MKNIFASILFTLLISTICLADIPRPDKPKADPAKKAGSIDTTLVIELNKNAKEARLIIPRSQLEQLRAELDAIDGGGDNTASAGIARLQTIVGGVFLSLAFVFAGFWFVKPGRLASNGGQAVAAAAVVFASGAFATLVFGNAGPPAEARWITGEMFTRSVHIYGFGVGKIKLEVSDDVKTPKLVVPNPPEENRKAEE